MRDIPDGYVLTRCDEFSAEKFREQYSSKKMLEICDEYIRNHPKDVYDTNDAIAIHNILLERSANSLKSVYGRNTTKRYPKG